MSVTDLQFAVLSSLAAGRRHGYGLLRDAEAALGKSLPVATAYAAIEGMVSRGWIIPDGEEVVHSRTRRYYALAPAGFQTLKARADQMEAQARLAHQRLRDATGKAATA
ncbi:PadR family transcriptional regulator [Microbacterium sp.]|uniref:PadR family transcriptional regulator n=1 Tax=Microbacterium sp. TaxID=51671 RepID=UPI00260031DD|nr:PadR family transcriptional regulator [Microbacterium sp.]MBT9607205.1 PadR family transcriptional regulator [Microbacterium sp.]